MNRILGSAALWLIAAIALLPLRGVAQDSAQPAPFKKEEIEQLVAPVALYPDPLVAQVLMASTYPLDVVSAARWVKANPNLKDAALEDAMQKQTWDPSVKSLTAFPHVLAMMNDRLDMTQKLGDAFLGQQKEVVDAIQQLRSRAQAAGNLKSGQEQTITSGQEGGATIIRIEPTQPNTVYVPTYNPTVVYGPWPYPLYPPYYYYPPGYAAGAALFAFTAAVIVGNALWGNVNWGRGDVNVNVNQYNNFNRTNIQNANWQHNAENRKGVPYRDQASQQKYGKSQHAGADTREAFRGRAEAGRGDITRGADQIKRDGGAMGERTGSGLGERGGVGDRGGAGAGGASGLGARPADAFHGVGSGGQTRDFSNRGAQSRASAGGFGGAGARAGGAGGRGGGGGRR